MTLLFESTCFENTILASYKNILQTKGICKLVFYQINFLTKLFTFVKLFLDERLLLPFLKITFAEPKLMKPFGLVNIFPLNLLHPSSVHRL